MLKNNNVELFLWDHALFARPTAEALAAYMEGLAQAAAHAHRHTPLKNYCTGLWLPGEHKSVEPMAARLAPDHVRRMHQSLHHLVADAPWDDQEMLEQVRQQVLPSHAEARSGSSVDHRR